MEQKYSDNPSYFVTLTFDDALIVDNPMLSSELNCKFFTDFIKRLSRRLQYHNIVDEFRYFGCGEYGDLGRAHYHVIIFNVGLSLSDFRVIIEDCWRVGFCTISALTDARCMYVAKYTCKELFDDDFYNAHAQKPFASMSTGRKKGTFLGYKFLLDNSAINRIKDEQLFFVRSSNGSVFNLPRVYSRYIFTKYERELHADFVANLNYPLSFGPAYARKSMLALRCAYDNDMLFFKRLREERKLTFGIYGKPEIES